MFCLSYFQYNKHKHIKQTNEQRLQILYGEESARTSQDF